MKKPIDLKIGKTRLNLAQLRHRLLQPISDFEKEIPMFGGFEDVGGAHPYRIDSRYYYRDNGSNILAVAHLDVALFLPDVSTISVAGDKIIFSPHLDDRLGAYIILDMLPALGINVDVLLTVGEESCASTAQNFTTDKKYNWGLSFDRRGEDVVMYQYSGAEWTAAIQKAGFKTSIGTYSDIAELDSLGCKFMNIGCGYSGEHTDLCHARLSQTLRQIERFRVFYNMNKDTLFPHTKSGYGRYHSYGRWDDGWEGRNFISRCSECGQVLVPNEYALGMCADCLVEMEDERASDTGLEQDEDFKQFEFDGKTYFRCQDSGEVMSADGKMCCPSCLVKLMPHEESIGVCDDCYQQDRGMYG